MISIDGRYLVLRALDRKMYDFLRYIPSDEWIENCALHLFPDMDIWKGEDQDWILSQLALHPAHYDAMLLNWLIEQGY